MFADDISFPFPSPHTKPQATLHPNGTCFGVQSMDNNVLMYSAEKLALLPKKRFAGHITAGYACEVGFSPDGKYVSSGNGDGELFVWNWGNTGITKHFKCHDKVCCPHTSTRATTTHTHTHTQHTPTGAHFARVAPHRVVEAPDLLVGQQNQAVGLMPIRFPVRLDLPLVTIHYRAKERKCHWCCFPRVNT